MADDRCKRKPLLYADLFKSPKIDVEKHQHVFEGSNSSSGDSCSSGFSTPFGSELSSYGTGSDDESLMAEYLSRQMAEFMLQEEEKTGDSCVHDEFEMKISPTVGKQRQNGYRRERPYMQQRGGSGMQAIFLAESGSGNGYTGTGVFLPRLPNDPTPVKRKSGCSTVLIPTRVLHALELHFSQQSNTATTTTNDIVGDGGCYYSHPSDDSQNGVIFQEKCDLNMENPSTNKEDEMRLPQEWTY